MGKAAKRIKSGDIKMTTHISKLFKQHTHPKSGVVRDNLTVTKAAFVEVHLLTNYAIANIVLNAEKILTYSGTSTFGTKTAEAATSVAFPGLLGRGSNTAGNKAVKCYEAWEADKNAKRQNS